MKTSRDARTASAARSRRRGIALLLTLLTLTVLSIVVSQMTTSTSVAALRLRARLAERRCRRALDSVPGIAARMLTERTENLRVDTLDDDWAKPKFFDIGGVRVEITIEDCQRHYDLNGLLAEDLEELETNKRQFVDFAVECGVSYEVATRLADTIALEAEARRLEDTTTQTVTDDPEEPSSTTTTSVPIWLEDFLSLPQLTDQDRQDVRLARVTREDPETFATYDVPFLRQITIWRTGHPNVNTASREVLLHELLNLENPERVVDEILEKREEEPFSTTAEIRSLEELSSDEARQIIRYVQLRSAEFRVTATATLLDQRTALPMRKPTMVLILKRNQAEFTTLWRSINV